MEPRRLGSEDQSALAEALSLAFRDNPLNRAVIGGGSGRRLRSNRAGMRATLAAARTRCSIWGVVPADGVCLGGLIAMPPDAWPLPPPPISDQLRLLLRQGWSTARRWGEVFEALRLVHPDEPNWYLALVGVSPGQQGRGLGAALLGRWIAEVDADGAAAYLETDRPELVSFYARFGFREIRSLELFGTPVRCLWRPGRRAGRHLTSK